MSIPIQVLLALGSVAVLLGLMAVVRKLAKITGLGAEVQRKLIHMGTGLYALTLPWLFPDRWPVYMLIGITLVVLLLLRLPRFSKVGLGATLHGIERKSYGDILLGLSIGVSFFLAQGDALLYVLPIAVLTLADAAAALVGTAYGTKLFQVEESHKSVEGSVVFFIVTLLIAVVSLMLLGDLPVLNILALSLMIAAFGTLVEAQSWRGFDNLFLPLGLLVFLSAHTNSSLTQLATLAALFLVSIVSFRLLGPKLGLTPHAARVYVVVVFLVLAVTAIQNAILPVLVLAAHAWCRTTNPCNDKFPDLDVVASLALFSFGWLILGNATGWNAISFYGISAMGLTMGLSVIALESSRALLRVPAILGITAVLYFIRQGISFANPVTSNWAEPLGGIALLVLALVIVMTVLFFGSFRSERVLKLTVPSVILPLGYYFYSMNQSGISP